MCPCCDPVLSPVLSLKIDQAVLKTTAPGDPSWRRQQVRRVSLLRMWRLSRAAAVALAIGVVVVAVVPSVHAAGAG